MKKIDKTNDKTTIIESGKAVVIYEPRGDYGLEGYSLNEVIDYRLIEPKNYYRVATPNFGDDYYETCSKTTFEKYFKKI